MKLIDLLEAPREYMDSSEYGAWVNAKNGESIAVEHMGHAEAMREILERYHDIEAPGGRDLIIYAHAFQNHYVRVTFPDHIDFTDLNIQGTSEDIQAVDQILLGSALQEDIDHVIVEKVYTDHNMNVRPFKSGDFYMPEDRIKLMRFIRNEN